jgi:hypothetical protein
VKVAWFPGPAGAGWVEAGNTGFTAAVKEGAIEVVDTKYGDTGKEAQLALLEDALTAHPDINYIVGTAVTAEAAMQLVRDRGLEDQVKILSYYFTPGVFEGIKRGRILAAPTDSAVIQARVAVDQAVRILEGKEFEKHVGPELYVIDKTNIETFDRNSSLARRFRRNSAERRAVPTPSKHSQVPPTAPAGAAAFSGSAGRLCARLGPARHCPGVDALVDVDFELAPGEVHVVGENAGVR